MHYSAIIPTHNRYRLLKRALESIYSQTLPPTEVIVVDDGSSDKTKKIVNDFGDILYMYQENSGVSSARNKGLKYAKSEFVAFLDDDDTWHKEKMAQQMEFLKHNPQFLWCYSDEKWVRDNKEVTVPKKYHKPKHNTFLEHIAFCNIAPSSVVIHKKIFDEIGCFDERLKVCEDYDLWLRILQHYPAGLVEKKLITKYAQETNQLGFCKNIESFRVLALEKHLKSKYHKEVKEVLIQKYTRLYQGALKRGLYSAKKYHKRLLALRN